MRKPGRDYSRALSGLRHVQAAFTRLPKQLGGGGMGIVYGAEDRRLQRSVALQFPPIDVQLFAIGG